MHIKCEGVDKELLWREATNGGKRSIQTEDGLVANECAKPKQSSNPRNGMTVERSKGDVQTRQQVGRGVDCFRG